jgi:enoyl-CoA hydratase/carnithine racemase
MADGSVLVRVEDRGPAGRVAFVTLDNPAKLNTLSRSLMGNLIAKLGQLGQDDSLRCVVLTGAGEKAFIGGANIAEMAALDSGSAGAFVTLIHQVCDALRRLPVPVIARIRGYALGAGLEVAASCDMRVASMDARFGMPEVRLGIPSVVEAALLPQLIGWGRARRLLLTGETISAQTALEWGLIEELAKPEAIDDAVERLVQSILDSGPRAVRLQKSLIREWEELPAGAAIRRGIAAFVHAWDTDEPRRMMRSFLERVHGRRVRPGSRK